jgi:hypothetical protein
MACVRCNTECGNFFLNPDRMDMNTLSELVYGATPQETGGHCTARVHFSKMRAVRLIYLTNLPLSLIFVVE